jgi:predicted DNA-binding transcriptional regulator AlpA
MKSSTYVMVDSGEFTHLLTKVDALLNEVKQLSSNQEQQEKYFSSAEDQQQLLSPKQLAKKLGKSEATIYAWRAKGIIKAHKIGHSTYFDFNEVLQVIKS